jgi:hypothetical protein
MLHSVLYQDDYVMLSADLFGGLRSHLLDRKILRKLSAQERAVVSATVEAACKNGAPTTTENNALAGFFCSVCEAFVVGSVTWKATLVNGAPTTTENNALAGFFCSVCEAFVVGSVTWKATLVDDPEVVGALIAKDYLEARK